MTDKRLAGQLGENLARIHLESQGYRFLAANYHTRLGELDLVMETRGEVVFVEVKSRASNAFGAPQEAVNASKQRKIIKAALSFIKERGLNGKNFRFDVVSIGPDGAAHFPNAFDAAASAYTL